MSQARKTYTDTPMAIHWRQAGKHNRHKPGISQAMTITSVQQLSLKGSACTLAPSVHRHDDHTRSSDFHHRRTAGINEHTIQNAGDVGVGKTLQAVQKPNVLAVPPAVQKPNVQAVPLAVQKPNVLAVPPAVQKPNVLAVPPAVQKPNVQAVPLAVQKPNVLAVPPAVQKPNIQAVSLGVQKPNILAVPLAVQKPTLQTLLPRRTISTPDNTTTERGREISDQPSAEVTTMVADLNLNSIRNGSITLGEASTLGTNLSLPSVTRGSKTLLTVGSDTSCDHFAAGTSTVVSPEGNGSVLNCSDRGMNVSSALCESKKSGSFSVRQKCESTAVSTDRESETTVSDSKSPDTLVTTSEQAHVISMPAISKLNLCTETKEKTLSGYATENRLPGYATENRLPGYATENRLPLPLECTRMRIVENGRLKKQTRKTRTHPSSLESPRSSDFTDTFRLLDLSSSSSLSAASIRASSHSSEHQLAQTRSSTTQSSNNENAGTLLSMPCIPEDKDNDTCSIRSSTCSTKNDTPVFPNPDSDRSPISVTIVAVTDPAQAGKSNSRGTIYSCASPHKQWVNPAPSRRLSTDLTSRGEITTRDYGKTTQSISGSSQQNLRISKGIAAHEHLNGTKETNLITKDCKNSKGCVDCKNSKGCVDFKNSKGCVDCKNSKGCVDCKNLKSCVDCKNLKSCVATSDQNRSTDLTARPISTHDLTSTFQHSLKAETLTSTFQHSLKAETLAAYLPTRKQHTKGNGAPPPADLSDTTKHILQHLTAKRKERLGLSPTRLPDTNPAPQQFMASSLTLERSGNGRHVSPVGRMTARTSQEKTPRSDGRKHSNLNGLALVDQSLDKANKGHKATAKPTVFKFYNGLPRRVQEKSEMPQKCSWAENITSSRDLSNTAIQISGQGIHLDITERKRTPSGKSSSSEFGDNTDTSCVADNSEEELSGRNEKSLAVSLDSNTVDPVRSENEFENIRDPVVRLQSSQNTADTEECSKVHGVLAEICDLSENGPFVGNPDLTVDDSAVRSFNNVDNYLDNNTQHTAVDTTHYTAVDETDNTQQTAVDTTQRTAADTTQLAAEDTTQLTAADTTQLTASDNAEQTAADNTQQTAADNTQQTAVDTTDNTQFTAVDIDTTQQTAHTTDNTPQTAHTTETYTALDATHNTQFTTVDITDDTLLTAANTSQQTAHTTDKTQLTAADTTESIQQTAEDTNQLRAVDMSNNNQQTTHSSQHTAVDTNQLTAVDMSNNNQHTTHRFQHTAVDATDDTTKAVEEPCSPHHPALETAVASQHAPLTNTHDTFKDLQGRILEINQRVIARKVFCSRRPSLKQIPTSCSQTPRDVLSPRTATANMSSHRTEQRVRDLRTEVPWERVHSAQAHVLRKAVRVSMRSGVRRPKSVLGVVGEKLLLSRLHAKRQPADRDKGETSSALTPGGPGLLSQRQVDYFTALWRRCCTDNAADKFVNVLKPLPAVQRRQFVSTMTSSGEDGEDAESMLVQCCMVGSLEMAQFLLQHCGASVEHKGTVTMESELNPERIKMDATPLWAAAVSGHHQLVQLLLRHGADVNSKASGGSTALHCACGRGHLAVAMLLLKAGADIHNSDVHGVTCLMAAVHSSELVGVLQRQGARSGDADREGNTALHYAVTYGSLAAVTGLVQFGGSCRQVNRDGLTPLQCAALRGWQHIVHYIVENTYHKFVEVVEAYELLGCGLVLLDDIGGGLEQWRKALLLRNSTLPKTGLRLERLPAFDQHLELTSVAQLDTLTHDRHAARLQALLIKERICGQHSKEFAATVLQLVDDRFRCGQYASSLQLMRHLFQLHLAIHHHHSFDLAYTLHQMVHLMLRLYDLQLQPPQQQQQGNCEGKLSAERLVTLDNILDLLNTLVEHLDKVKAAMIMHKACNKQQFRKDSNGTPGAQKVDNLECACETCRTVTGMYMLKLALPCQCVRHRTQSVHQSYLLALNLALYLVRFLTFHTGDVSHTRDVSHTGAVSHSAQLKEQFRSVVYKFVKADHRTQRGDSLLHLCFPLCKLGVSGRTDREQRAPDVDHTWHTAPSLALLDTLLQCGAQADAVNDKGESPLFTLLRPADPDARRLLTQHPQRDSWVTLLLQHGAHVDRVTWSQPRQGLWSILRDIDHPLLTNPLQYVTLQCLAARAIQKHGVTYADHSLLPWNLIRFVHFH